MKKLFLLIVAFGAMALEPAFAYTGPGLGAATIAMVVGFFTSIFIALFAVIWYPVKRLLKNRKKPQTAGVAAKAGEEAAALKTAETESGAAGNTAD